MPQSVFQSLMEGNARFVAGAMKHPHQDPAYRLRINESQHPVAAVLGCADSRVPPEIIFDQGLGDLFVVRNAGNLPMGAAIGSLEFAVSVLKVKVILVLGHSGCGAVTAAMNSHDAPGQMEMLMTAVNTAIGDVGDMSLKEAVQANVKYTVKQLLASEPVLAAGVRNGELGIDGVYYDFATGCVTEIPVE